MAAINEIRLYNTSGTLLAVFDNPVSAEYSRKIHTPGLFSMVIDASDNRVGYFGTDYIIEVWRKNPEYSIDTYREWSGFVRATHYSFEEDGTATFSVRAVETLSMLRRATISYNPGTLQARKIDFGENAMKEYVLENVGINAGDASRWYPGIRPGLLVDPANDMGNLWEGDRSGKNLLDVLQDIARQSDVYFDLVPDPHPNNTTFRFKCYYPYRGVNRTLTGIDPLTGLNAYGQVPAIFSRQMDNIRKLEYDYSREAEANVVHMTGQGAGTSKQVYTAQNYGALDDSPWNVHETTRNASQEDTAAGLMARGDAELQSAQPIQSVDTVLKENGNNVYPRDFGMGDWVTIRDDNLGITFNIMIIGTQVKIQEGQLETLDFTVSNTW